MHSIKTSLLLMAVVTVCVSGPGHADLIKLSKSGICHSNESPNYNRTTNYQSFSTMEQCLEHGRLPKNAPRKSVVSQTTTQQIPKYDRGEYRHWIDENGDGLNTRHELLKSMSVSAVTYNDKRSRVLRGKWFDSYSGKYYYNSKDLQIDHIVPIKYAHDRGAWRWDQDKKQFFANDVENLLPVFGPLNQEKSASGPSDWMPPSQAYRCQYVIRFHRIFLKYQLEYKSSEERVINRMLAQCRS